MLSAIYGKIMNLRNTLYDKGVFELHDLRARTISVGNITTGGTGKTPLVAYIAEVLAARGEKVCILTRGYGRADSKQRVLVSDGEQVFVDAQKGGDEPVELAHKLLGRAIIIADADRVSAAEWALRKFGVTVFLLDDGFQHRKVKRDLDIVCIDATNPFGDGKLLPFGRLRESLDNLARANAVVITRADLVSDISNLKSEISNVNSSAKIFEAMNSISAISPIEEFHAKTQSEKSIGSALAFCGLGNPESFFELLRRESFTIVDSKVFADHHHYSQAEVSHVEAQAKSRGAKCLLTTAKDAVKISKLKFGIPCFVVEIEINIDNKNAFEALL